MPSFPHEAVLLLFRNRAELAPELLRVELPAYTEARVESAAVTEIAPAEYAADLVVLLVRGEPVFAIIVEVQLARKERKRFTWPVYLTGIGARFECDAVVLVVAPTVELARWAATAITLGPGSVVQPPVLGPDAVPVVVDRAIARELRQRPSSPCSRSWRMAEATSMSPCRSRSQPPPEPRASRTRSAACYTPI